MKAIIVDDEPKAIDLIRGYLTHFRNVEIAGTFRNGLKAFEYLSSHPIDVIFLDITMPHISGVSLAKMLDKKIKIIFTTAYSDFAVESYEVSAVDYLLKPITLDRFMLAMSKVLEEGKHTDPKPGETLWIKSGGRMHKLTISEILYLQKEGNYMTYFLPNYKILARESITEALEQLPDPFCQIHKSYIINLQNVTAFESDRIFIGETALPIGASFKDLLKTKLEYK